jgi:hypothetical protein
VTLGLFHVRVTRIGGMESNHDRPSNKGLVFFVSAALVLVPLLYIASIGSAYRITNFQLNVYRSPSFPSEGQRICEILYWPICRACEHSEFIANSVSWYLGLWR